VRVFLWAREFKLIITPPTTSRNQVRCRVSVQIPLDCWWCDHISPVLRHLSSSRSPPWSTRSCLGTTGTWMTTAASPTTPTKKTALGCHSNASRQSDAHQLRRQSLQWQCDNDNRKQYKYMCITTNQQDTKSNPIPNPPTKPHAIVNIQLNIVTCATYRDKFIRDNTSFQWRRKGGGSAYLGPYCPWQLEPKPKITEIRVHNNLPTRH